MSESRKNRLQAKIEAAFSQTKEPDFFSFEWALKKISIAYGIGVRLRARLYEKKIFKQETLPCFVISIGNIVVGGAGKTPMAMYLAEILKSMGKKTVVVSRGYKGSYTSDALVVSDGIRVFSKAEECGDEPYMMAQRKLFPVVVGKSRFQAGQKAIQTFNPDVIILDDGFQHLQLKRDLDLLLFDYSNPLGNGRLLPAGRLRESLNMATKRAHALVFTRCPDIKVPGIEQPETHTNDKILKQKSPIQIVQNCFKQTPCFRTVHVPFLWNSLSGNKGSGKQRTDIGNLKGKKALLFSGIANNDSFFQTMETCGVNIADHLEFQDHYRYKESDFERINKTAVNLGAQMILTTEKDMAKIKTDIKWKKELAVVGIRIEFEAPDDFKVFIDDKIKQK